MVEIQKFILRIPYEIKNIKKIAVSKTRYSGNFRYIYDINQGSRVMTRGAVMYAKNLEDFKKQLIKNMI